MNKMSTYREKLLEDLIDKLVSVFRGIHKEQNFPFGKLVLSRQQMMIMFFINENKGAASVKEIIRFLRVTPGAVTQFVDGLVKKKLVKREANSGDRRSVNIKLTAAVEKKLRLFKRSYIKTTSQAFQGLSNRELGQFIGLIEKIIVSEPKINIDK
jgi:DNA-binding MarR family transcriptional regulator